MSKKSVDLAVTCPECNKEFEVEASLDPVQLAPDTRCKIMPVGSVFVYKISNEQIKQFIVAKAKAMVPDVKVEVVPLYTERRRRKESDPHRSYASLRIAFSDAAVEKTGNDGWFGKIGETNSNIRIVGSLFKGIIERYQYNRKEIEKWLDSYKTLEQLEENLGMTEQYISKLRQFCTPQRVPTNNKEQWIIFSAAAENVIYDMLSDPSTNTPSGRIQIQDVVQVSKDVVEFIIYVHPSEMRLKEDPFVRKIMMGEEKLKK